MMRKLVSAALVFGLMIGAATVYPTRFSIVYAEEEWRAEFDDICGRTEFAMGLSAAELQGLIERCDKLKPRIQKLDESAAKVFLKRLQMCRDLFAYVLESKSN